MSSLPKRLETNLGIASVIEIPSRNAKKIYKCPLCEYEIELGEAHVTIVPPANIGQRRHCHTDCVKRWLEQGLIIQLHPRGQSGWKEQL